jgi:hypothetical protein
MATPMAVESRRAASQEKPFRWEQEYVNQDFEMQRLKADWTKRRWKSEWLTADCGKPPLKSDREKHPLKPEWLTAGSQTAPAQESAPAARLRAQAVRPDIRPPGNSLQIPQMKRKPISISAR